MEELHNSIICYNIYCDVCCKIIKDIDKVEILIDNPQYNPKHILGKYKWIISNYCFQCLENSKSYIWKLYLLLLNNANCHSTYKDIILQPIPIRLTQTLQIHGPQIMALYYHNNMYSSKLNTGMTDFEFYKFQDKIKIQKENIINNINLHNLLTSLSIT